jgi:hypothetical protein
MTLDERLQVAKLVLEYMNVLAWPIVAIIVICMFRSHIVSLLKRLKDAELPGGVRINLQETIQQAERLSDQVREIKPPEEKRNVPIIPLTEANARMLELGLQPSPSGLNLDYYRSLADQDPNIALAGLRIEIETLTRNLVKGFGMTPDTGVSLGQMVRQLHSRHRITNQQRQLIEKIAAVCNSAVHGERRSWANPGDR